MDNNFSRLRAHRLVDLTFLIVFEWIFSYYKWWQPIRSMIFLHIPASFGIYGKAADALYLHMKVIEKSLHICHVQFT